MSESLSQKAFDSIAPEALAAMSPKGRLEAFAWEYCKAVSEASDDLVAAEAASLGIDFIRLAELRNLVHGERARILAEVLRIFGDREHGTEQSTKLDRLLDEVLGTSGFEGTIPG